MSGYPSIDRPWLKYYKKRPEDLVYPHKTLWQYAYDNNKDYPNDIVFQYFDRKISYKTFFENVYKAAKAFAGMGVKEGDVVTIMSMHTPETIYTIYGLSYVGAVANLVYPTLTESELSKTLSDTNSKALFILDAVYEKVFDFINKILIPVVILSVDESMPFFIKNVYRLKKRGIISTIQSEISYSDFLKKGDDVKEVLCSTDSYSPAVIVYTSGTTGEPKGVEINSDSINNLAIQHMNGLVEVYRGCSMLFILPPFIGFGMTHLHIYISGGIKLFLHIDLNPCSVTKQLFKCKPYAFLTGPAFIPDFIKHKSGNLRNLKYFIGGGGVVTEQQMSDINRLLGESGSSALYSNGYGMTEACSSLSVNVNPLSKQESVGLPWLDTNVKIINPENGHELKYGEVGELWFSTSNLMLGYYNDEKSTKEILVTDQYGKRWLRTGDLGTVDEDGYIFIKGRIKRIYITRGRDGLACKLFPQHIENVFMNRDDVCECAVIVREDDEKMNVAIAFIEVKGKCTSKDELIKNLFDFAQDKLPEYMKPSEIHIIDKMPITPNGKINYRELEKEMKSYGNV